MDLDARIDKLAALMEERLGIRGKGFEAKLARAGRRLPKHLRREGQKLVAARALVAHPRLGRQVDHVQLEKAATMLERYLKSIDADERRWTLAINWLAGNALNILIVVGLTFAVAAWRGLV